MSDKGHISAQKLAYPLIFNVPVEKISYESVTISENTSERNRIYDGEMAVDRIISVNCDGYKAPLKFTVQERFARSDFINFQGATITEWNYNSNLPSELHKLTGGLFLFGYFDETKNDLLQFVLFSSSTLLLLIKTGKITYQERKRNRRTNQTFLLFSFDSLRKAGLILYEKDFRPES